MDEDDYFKDCLNPCFSGGWSRRMPEGIPTIENWTVLILVLVEDGLGEVEVKDVRSVNVRVLILVLVEDGLGEFTGYIL